MGNPAGRGELQLLIQPPDYRAENAHLLPPALHREQQPQQRDGGCSGFRAHPYVFATHQKTSAQAIFRRHADQGLFPTRPPRSSRDAISREAWRSTFGRRRIRRAPDWVTTCKSRLPAFSTTPTGRPVKVGVSKAPMSTLRSVTK